MKQHYERRKMPLTAHQTPPVPQHVNTPNHVFTVINNNNTNINRNNGITYVQASLH